jgi:hypothetical protein
VSKLGIISWDWCEQPDLAVLARAVYAVSGGLVHITQVDTGDDQYAIVVSDRPLGVLEASDLYRARVEGGAP